MSAETEEVTWMSDQTFLPLKTLRPEEQNQPFVTKLCKGYLTKKKSDGVLCHTAWPPQ